MTTKPRKRTVSYIVKLANDGLGGHHCLGVNALAYSPVSQRLISGGRDGVLAVWRPGTTSPSTRTSTSASEIKRYVSDHVSDEQEIIQLETSIQDCAFKPIDQTAHDYSLALTSHQHLDWINDIAIVSNTSIATCSNDLSVKLCGPGGLDTTLGYHDDYVKTLGFSATCANQLVSAGLDRTVKVWDIPTKTEVSSYTFDNEKFSVYATDCHENLLIAAGPACTIALFDRRTMNRPVKTFLGHTDTVRTLKLGATSFLSGSSDTTVRLWDLRTNRATRLFDMHDASVFCLATPEGSDGFDIFYSGDRSGVVLKTDLRASYLDPRPKSSDYLNDKVNESLGISTVVANLEHPVLSLAEGAGLLWTSSSASTDSFISSWRIPDTEKLACYQGIKLNRNLQILEPQGDQSVHSDDIVSQFSHDDMDHIDQALTSQTNLDDVYDDSQGFDSFFVRTNGGPDSDYVAASVDGDYPTLDISYERIPDTLITVIPYSDTPCQTIAGSNGLIKARMLNNRRHVAVMDQNGSIYVVDIVSNKLIKTLPQACAEEDEEAMADTFEEATDHLQTEETLPSWCTVQTKSGMLFVTLQDATFSNTEIYCDTFQKEYNIDLDATETRYNIGKVVLRSLFFRFTTEVFKPEEIAKRSVQSVSIKESSDKAEKGSEKKEAKKNKFSFRLGYHKRDEKKKEEPESDDDKEPPKSADELKTEAIAQIDTTPELLRWIDSEGITEPQHVQGVPYFDYDGSILLTINENIRNYGNDTKTLFLTSLAKTATTSETLQDLLPVWVSRAVLLGRYPHKEVPKVSFVLLPKKGSGLSLLESNKLSAYSMLRVSKVMEFVRERLPPEQREVNLGLYCKDVALAPDTTLGTIKARIWKSNGDVQLDYFAK